jgi:uncharacterized protein YecA (UPF0149 family)
MQSYQSPHLNAIVTEVFTGQSNKEVLGKMDQRKQELERQGCSGFRRQKIGVNATCPCGSGLKFKKCCLRLSR